MPKVLLHQPGYIFCFYIEEINYYKIGVIRTSPYKYLKAERLKYSGSKRFPYPLVMLHCCSVDDIEESEKNLHKFEQYHVGEGCFEFDSQTLNQVINTMEYCRTHVKRKTTHQNRRQRSISSLFLRPKIGRIVTTIYCVCILSSYHLKSKSFRGFRSMKAHLKI